MAFRPRSAASPPGFVLLRSFLLLVVVLPVLVLVLLLALLRVLLLCSVWAPG